MSSPTFQDQTPYRSETQRVSVTVEFADGSEMSGDIHLQASPHHAGFETPLEMLIRRDAFFPLRLSSGAVVLISKAQTAVVSCAFAEPDEQADRLSVATPLPLDVEMVSQRRYRGTAYCELPPGHTRPLDLFNESGTFVALVDGAEMHYVNRMLARAVYPTD